MKAEGRPRAEEFEAIYADNRWSSSESPSGPGSEYEYTETYRSELVDVIEDLELTSMFDAPCGDLNWIGGVIARTGISYRGGDISRSAIDLARQKEPNLDVVVFDVCQDEFPHTDVWHCRDCLFHLSFDDIRLALAQFLQSGTPYALITTHRGLLRNNDIETGGARYLNLQKPPLAFGPAQRYLKDFRPGRDFPRYVGLWSSADIARVLDRWKA